MPAGLFEANLLPGTRERATPRWLGSGPAPECAGDAIETTGLIQARSLSGRVRWGPVALVIMLAALAAAENFGRYLSDWYWIVRTPSNTSHGPIGCATHRCSPVMP